MICPDCHEAMDGRKCLNCGWTKGQKREAENHPPGYLDKVIPHRCAYRTGDFQCRWGKYAPRREETVYCVFHREVLRQDQTDTHSQFALFLAERKFYQDHYPFQSFLGKDDLKAFARRGPAAVQQIPFWYQPIDIAWKALTGLPVPASTPSKTKPLQSVP